MLKNLTENQIKQFAGSTIYARGYDYYKAGRVAELIYQPDLEKIQAMVSGSYGSYGVTVQLIKNTIKASCECPYEGYPCKHVVAILLTFSKDHKHYEQKAQKPQSVWKTIEQAMNNLPKKDLVNMILACAQDYPDFHRKLLVRFQPDEEATLATLLQQIGQVFPDPGSRRFTLEQIAGKLSVILHSVREAVDTLKVAVSWAVADEILGELNNYGMDDEDLEEVLFEALETLETMLVGNVSLRAEKQSIIGELMDYYTWGNSGVVDSIYDTVHNLCSEKADFQIVIAKLEANARASSYSKTLLADLLRSHRR